MIGHLYPPPIDYKAIVVWAAHLMQPTIPNLPKMQANHVKVHHAGTVVTVTSTVPVMGPDWSGPCDPAMDGALRDYPSAPPIARCMKP